MITITAYGQAAKPADYPETFAAIPGFSKYSVSDRGRIMGPSGIMADFDNSTGYRQIILPDDSGKRHHLYVHRLLLLAHVGPAPTARHQAAHWNNNRADNRLENLRWATRRENAADKRRHAAERRVTTH